jgi:hypothetical protein
LVRNSRSRPIGLEKYRSIDPPAMKSGKMPAVEIRASTTAPHATHAQTAHENAYLYQYCGSRSGMSSVTSRSPRSVTPSSANAAITTADRTA